MSNAATDTKCAMTDIRCSVIVASGETPNE